jgi:shikimate kinase
MEIALARSPRLFLIGYRGVGKTTVARLVADQLGWAWKDADALLEERAGRSIRQIFIDDGEESFRNREAMVLEDLCRLENHVIATGGGVILREENRRRLSKGSVVWLRAPAELLWQRLQADVTTAERRPNLAQGGLAEIEEMLRVRTPFYEACQHFTVDAAILTPEQIAQAIVHWMRV